MKIYYKNKSFDVRVRILGFFGKIRGLMFRTRNTENLIFAFNREVSISIHSFFVFFPFLAVWVDGKNNVLETQIVRPFIVAVLPKKKFKKLIELPFNNKNKSVIQFLVGKRKI